MPDDLYGTIDFLKRRCRVQPVLCNGVRLVRYAPAHGPTASRVRAALFLANGDIASITGKRIVDSGSVKRLPTLTLTCGTYDAAGDFVCRIRLLAKSSVSGGILAMLPGDMAACT